MDKEAMRAYNKEKAADWLQTINQKWAKEIQWSKDHSYLERNFCIDREIPNGTYEDTEVYIWDTTVEKAVQDFLVLHPEEKLCVLNFADYKYPGGRFLSGSHAQEESICHNSGLYPILDSFGDEYSRRRIGSLNGGLYNEDFIYSEQVPFIKNPNDKTMEMIKADVLTYAAPCLCRRSPSSRYYNIMYRRMIYALVYPAVYRGATSIMLGAWGCGVFNNPPAWVAKQWNYLCENGCGKYYHYIIHPVPYGKNTEPFRENILWKVK